MFSNQRFAWFCFPLAVLFVPALVLAQDVTPPTLVSLTIEPSTINVWDSDQNVTFTWHLTDDLSGIARVGNFGLTQTRLYSPSGNQSHDAIAYERNLVSGNMTDGIFRDIVKWPRYSETGVWTPRYANLCDEVGNRATLWDDDLANMGVNLNLTVIAEPIPEPSTFTLAALGLLGFVAWQRPKRRRYRVANRRAL